jgi:hypothetical protein
MIPAVDRDAIIAAMEQFDQDERDPVTGHWNFRGAEKFAIVHSGRQYPVKKILAVATGAPVNTFSGGDTANTYLETRGFTISDLYKPPLSPQTARPLAEIQALFTLFRANPSDQLLLRIRQAHLPTLQRLITDGKDMDLDTFNREIWRIESESQIGDTAIVLTTGESWDSDALERIATALDDGSIDLHGNYIWGSASRVYGPMLRIDDAQRLQHIQAALTILRTDSLTPLEKAEQLLTLPGFGPNIATGLVMVVHPMDFALHNAQSKAALTTLGYPAEPMTVFEDYARLLREQLGADDFIELDLFLFHLSMGHYGQSSSQRYWWVNQGFTYRAERDGGYVWAPKLTKTGRSMHHHRNVAELRPGDLVLHYANTALRAFGVVTGPPSESPNPSDTNPDAPMGYRVPVRYTELDPQPKLEVIPIEWRQAEKGPFTQQGAVNQGYLYPISASFAHRLGGLFDLSALMGDVPDTTGPAAWLFQAHPQRFDLRQHFATIDDALDGSWSLTRYRDHVRPGDHVIVWQSGDQAGVYALGKITGEPYHQTYIDQDRPAWVQADSDGHAEEWRVPIRYTQILTPPLLKQQLVDDPILSTLQVLRAPTGTNFRVTPEEWEALQQLIAARSLQPVAYQEPPFTQIVRVIADRGLRLPDTIIRRYHLALKTRGFVILAGGSGTGKTWLTEAYATAVDAVYQLVPVAPNWTTNEDLLGYFNPLDQRYHDTPFSMFLREAAREWDAAQTAERPAQPYHLVLDEMNLARVEYYFATFLSAMEVRARAGTAEIALGPYERAVLPPNLCFIGTINVDETTQSIANKVIDRAQLIELDAPRAMIEAHLGTVLYADRVMAIWDIIQPVAPFAFRVLDEIASYMQAAAALDTPWEDALDEQVLQKILPKLNGMDPRLGHVLDELLALLRDPCPLSAAKLQRMQEGYRSHGIASFF